MIRKNRNLWLGVAAVALAQTAVLGWMVWDRASLLKNGREVVLQVTPVDPRDLFRGDYVVLGYPFTRTGEVKVPPGTRRGDVMYATLKPLEGSAWDIAALTPAYPAASDVPAGHIVIKGRVADVWDRVEDTQRRATLHYGIESFFVPEGEGKDIEKVLRDQKVEAVIALGRGGEAALKALVVDGKRVYDEPLL